MNFASIEFFVFLAVVYSLYRIFPHRWQNLMLLGASYYFYGSWDWRFLSLIGFSTIVDYGVGKSLYSTTNSRRRTGLLLVSLIVNLGMLGIFKYYGFFADSLVNLLNIWNIRADWRTLNVVLPVGISFYTFQTLSYTVDIYRRKLEPTRNFLDFALFVAFFPQLVAGPIERADRILPQIARPRQITFSQSARGCFLILFGLFKKVAIADGVAASVNSVYNNGSAGTIDILLATYLFAIQIYCDFSGYSDIARGVSKLLGFELMVNFDTPYFAINPSDFWRRWHISLSTWLRDYLYIPLGGNRQGAQKTYRNLMVTMILGGLWHGAAWNFVYWGIYQGLILCIHRAIAGAKPVIRAAITYQARLRRFLLTVGFFHVVCYGWLLFRATSFEQIYVFTNALFFHPVLTPPTIALPPLSALLGIITLFWIDLTQYLSGQTVFYRHWSSVAQSAMYAVLLFAILMGLANDRATFIYFQF